MAEWLYEAGIGEARAALVANGRIIEMAIEPEGGVRAGAVMSARLLDAADASGRGRILLETGDEARLAETPRGLTEGAPLTVEVTREAYVEPGGALKLAVARFSEASARPGPDLRERIAGDRHPVRVLVAGDADMLEAHGWSEALEEARTGIVATPEALLRISLTPAMTLIDVDGGGPVATLAVAGIALAGAAIRRLGIVGSIGIDLPTLTGKPDRHAAAAALDAALPPPFERTAVNGFGFLQLVRRRVRPSLPESLAADPLSAAARALLRRAERATGRGALTIAAAPALIDAMTARPQWLAELRRRIGAELRLQARPTLAISAGHAQRDHP